MASVMGAYSLLNFIPVAALAGAGTSVPFPSFSVAHPFFPPFFQCNLMALAWRHHDCGGAPHLQMVLPGHGLGCRVAQVRPRSFELAPQGAFRGEWRERLHWKTMGNDGNAHMFSDCFHMRIEGSS